MQLKKLIIFYFTLSGYALASSEWTEFSFILKPSQLGGIGVFATHDIAKGTQVFRSSFELRRLKTKDIPSELVKYCIYLNDEECLCPKRFDHMEIGWYLNHSPDPNIANKFIITNPDEIDNTDNRRVYAVKDIKAGDEIEIDYNALGEPENLKEDYYKLSL
jgi:hypothetical protein